MDLDLQKQIFIPNPLILMPVKLDDSSFILFYFNFFCQSKGVSPFISKTCDDHCAWGVMGGVGGWWGCRSSNANILQLSAAGGNSLTERNSETFTQIHFTPRSKHPTAEVTCENKCLHRKAQRKPSATHFPKQKQERL